jgi:amidase
MDSIELAFAGIARQARLIADGEVSARELLEVYLHRIAQLNPTLNAIRVVFAERARLEADQADGRRGAGDRRPLLGVPFLVKDNIDVAGELTPSGTRAVEAPARADAELVRRLRAAGAVIVGKTHTPELCIWPFTESVTNGITRNPWDLERTPGGSSGGSAAAVAAGLAGAALASDGAGSIRIPASWCGLFGLKPQWGRVPIAPDSGHWHDLSVLGVLTRSVADTALFLDAVTAGPPEPGGPPAPERPFAESVASDPERLRIAVATNPPTGLIAPLHEDNRAALLETVELLRSLGHDVRETRIDYGRPPVTPDVIARYLRGIHDEGVGLAHPERLERRTRGVMRLGGLIPPVALGRLRAREDRWRAQLGALLREHDVLLTPTTAVPPPRVAQFAGRGALWTLFAVIRQVPYCPVWNATGQPGCSVPAGFDGKGLPRAVQLVGRRDDEATLLSLAAQIERARPWSGARPPMAATAA